MRGIALLASLLGVAQACAAWEFSAPIEVAPAADEAFYHLDAMGRRSIAVNDDRVAVAWEDNRSGEPQAYIALKHTTEDRFDQPERVNDGAAAFAPGVAALADGFVAGWSDDNAVWARYIDADGLGESVRLSTALADQIALARIDSDQAVAVWMQRENGSTCLYAARLALDGNRLKTTKPVSVSDCARQRFQSQPAVTADAEGALIVWQDRTTGANRIFASRTRDYAAFSSPVQINETVQKSATWGAGSSGINPVVAQGTQGYWVAWLDKRADRAGYKIYSAHSDDGLHWSENLKVQDDFGDETPQWSVTLAVSPGGAGVASWSDGREGKGQDIYLAHAEDHAWSDNHLFDAAAGAGDQGSPSLVIDAAGTLHLVWIDKAAGTASVLKYATGTP